MGKVNAASVINSINANPAGYGILMTASFAQFGRWGGKYTGDTENIINSLIFSYEVFGILDVDPIIWQYINVHSNNQKVSDTAKQSMHLLNSEPVKAKAFIYFDQILDFMKQQSNPLKFQFTKDAISFISQLKGLSYNYDRPNKYNYESDINVSSKFKKDILFPELTFSQKTEITINNEFLLPIPDGFKFSDDSDIIGGHRLLTIVPDNYSFFDDPMEAPVALSIQAVVIPCGRQFDPDYVSIYENVFSQNVTIFTDGVEAIPVNPRPGCGFIYQNVHSDDDSSWNKILGLIFANENAYIAHIIFNHSDGYSFDLSLLNSFEKEVKKWFSQIHLINEEKPEIFPESDPDFSLYPHYQQILDAGQSFPGVKVVVNSSGTEYEFLSLDKALTEDTSLADRISRSDSGANTYQLAKKAKQYSHLFHVTQEYFNPSRDRECEINSGYLHRAYMFSALRSFAWTVSSYCDAQGLLPADLTCNTLRNLVSFIAEKNWLNYDGKSYCRALCSGNDIHVFYVPISITENDFRDLLHLIEEPQDSVFSKTIPCTVSSLDALRVDLSYLQPAIEKLCTYLQSNRSSYSDQLTGNEADIVYAWCSLALAAQKPFFIEDGPMHCFFSFPEVYQQSIDYHSSDDNYGESFDIPQYPPDFQVIENGVLIEYKGSDTKVTIPEGIIKVDGFDHNDTIETIVLPRTACEIGYGAFKGCTSLKNVIFQSDIQHIEPNAFSDCISLEYIELPSTVTAIGRCAFYNCSSLKYIKIPSAVTTIDDCAFWECSSLKCVEIPSTVTSIGEWAFSDCESLERVVLHDGLQQIGENTFADCMSLKHIEIPCTVTTIGCRAFYDCDSLKSIQLSENLKVLGKEAFSWCKNLQSVSIPGSLKIIDEQTFEWCENLQSVEIKEGVKEIQENAFTFSNLKTIILPASLNFIANDAFDFRDVDEGDELIDCMVLSGSYAAKFAEENFSFCPIYRDSNSTL